MKKNVKKKSKIKKKKKKIIIVGDIGSHIHVPWLKTWKKIRTEKVEEGAKKEKGKKMKGREGEKENQKKKKGERGSENQKKQTKGDGRGGEKKMRGAVTEGVQRFFFFFFFPWLNFSFSSS